MQWATLVSDLQSYCEQDPGQPGTAAFTAQIPTFVNNAELRIYRDLDFLATRGTNASLTFLPGIRTLMMGGMQTGNAFGYPVVVQGISAITPKGVPPSMGTRVTFDEVSMDFIDSYWPTESATSAPSYGQCYFAMLDHQTAIVAPTPDQAYTAEVTGTWRPAPMGPTNVETYIGDQFYDLLLAASMIEASAWLRNWSSADDDPKMAQSWENHYQLLKDGALEEENRRKSSDPGWVPFSPTPLAKPRS